jgi:succinyldiaminopimelate transaminase
MTDVPGWSPPPYPYDRLGPMRRTAERHDGGVIDFSIGSPCDPPLPAVIDALASSGTERGYPPSIGTVALREAASRWMARRFDVHIEPGHIAATIGSKEFVASVPGSLHLRSPGRSTVLFPAVAYPTYEMGALLAGLRPVPVAVDDAGAIRLDTIDPADAADALCLWVNSPGNPDGHLDDLGAAAQWGRAHDVPVFSDECYTEFTWRGAPRTILAHGSDGVVAVHSLSKRSNLAGLRVGCYAGDPEVVAFLAEVRKHAGAMVPGPAQAAAVVALDDDEHVARQRARYLARLGRTAEILSAWSGCAIDLPAGGFYLWFDCGDAWAFAEQLAKDGGALVSPGDLYGAANTRFVRVAVVEPDDRVELLAERLGQPRRA